MTLYRIALNREDIRDTALLAGISKQTILLVMDELRSQLVPVEPCKHGKYDRHMASYRKGGEEQGKPWATRYECPGAGLEDTT